LATDKPLLLYRCGYSQLILEIMFETNLKSLTEFLEYWNNNHLVDEKEGTKPFNGYAMAALGAGCGFTLKWFVKKDDFEKLVNDLNYEFEEGENRIFLEFGEDRIEIEIDTRGIISQVYEDTQEIRDIVNSVVNS
jgi:hypothetical protein